jgi:hypothetical protein
MIQHQSSALTQDQQLPDSAERNSALQRAECHVRQLAADDRNSRPAQMMPLARL